LGFAPPAILLFGTRFRSNRMRVAIGLLALHG
jgi:hypothetical protein